MNQESKTARIFLACACGSGIGSLAALQLGHFWGLGALLGALAGYLTYDLEQVINMVPVAWKMTASVASLKINSKSILDWFKNMCFVFVGFFSVALSFTTLIIFTAFFTQDQIVEVIKVVFGLSLACSLLATLPLSVHFTFGNDSEKKKIKMNSYIMIYHMNPLMVYLYYPAQGIIWTVTWIPAGAIIAYNFLKTLFLLIHSDLRLLCGINSLIGTVIGYFFGNALVGALAGGLLGIIDYEIVSKQILKVHLKS